jgi:phosphinothricin acetyltransferase
MSRSELTVREATPEDAEAIARIYNQGIEDRLATLETLPRSPDERRQWMAARSERYPVLVAATAGGEVVGWASLNQFNPRPAYDFVADFSVYVDRAARGSGVGNALLDALERRARQIGFHKLVLAAFPTNTAGMRLYERRGFTRVGIYHEQGQLDGAWVDVVLMEKILS